MCIIVSLLTRLSLILLTPYCLFNIWKILVFFVELVDTPVLDWWWQLSKVSQPEWIPRLKSFSTYVIFKFTFKTTPFDLLITSIEAEAFW